MSGAGAGPATARPRHAPYAAGKTPFTIGLEKLDPARWIEPDERLEAELAEKGALIAADLASVFKAEPGTREAQAEVRDALAAHLLRDHSEVFARAEGGIRIVASGRSVPLPADDPAPLLSISRLVQEDLCLMRRGEEGWRLAAASLCFPSSWSLAEKFGRTLDAIHEPVPGYADFMAGRVNRMFDHLRAEQPVWRLNWSIQDDGHLAHPEPKSARRDWSLREPVVRVERQTLTRLPICGDILFTIRIHLDPVAAFATHPDGAAMARALHAQLVALNEAQLAYKNLAEGRDVLLARLETFFTAPG